ncbi:hypothetical protein DM860_013038 [Cuscuta australis]|uniref:cytokinin riboside 5'-monophosphate phosphoribohydrolase n=1 Tax=Cuscuta australis TaxID=267555 RepID=A0A328D235_9ASTE|nr:hypothetical protein DM860_013038 [Cuscuta australis]
MSKRREWMGRRSMENGWINPEFLYGVEEYIKVAFEDNQDMVKCPCKKCRLRLFWASTKIIPRLIARHLYGPTIGIERRVPDYNLGCYEMCHFVDAFVILPGGVETIEGLFSIISWACDGIHTKPIGLLNVKGYFYGLLNCLNHCVSQNFLECVQRRLFISSLFDAELLDRLEFAIAFPGTHATYEAQVNSGEVDLTLHLGGEKRGTRKNPDFDNTWLNALLESDLSFRAEWNSNSVVSSIPLQNEENTSIAPSTNHLAHGSIGGSQSPLPIAETQGMEPPKQREEERNEDERMVIVPGDFSVNKTVREEVKRINKSNALNGLLSITLKFGRSKLLDGDVTARSSLGTKTKSQLLQEIEDYCKILCAKKGEDRGTWLVFDRDAWIQASGGVQKGDQWIGVPLQFSDPVAFHPARETLKENKSEVERLKEELKEKDVTMKAEIDKLQKELDKTKGLQQKERKRRREVVQELEDFKKRFHSLDASMSNIHHRLLKKGLIEECEINPMSVANGSRSQNKSFRHSKTRNSRIHSQFKSVCDDRTNSTDSLNSTSDEESD